MRGVFYITSREHTPLCRIMNMWISKTISPSMIWIHWIYHSQYCSLITKRDVIQLPSAYETLCDFKNIKYHSSDHTLLSLDVSASYVACRASILPLRTNSKFILKVELCILKCKTWCFLFCWRFLINFHLIKFVDCLILTMETKILHKRRPRWTWAHPQLEKIVIHKLTKINVVIEFLSFMYIHVFSRLYK